MAATSKPVCCWISTKQVGLVTLIARGQRRAEGAGDRPVRVGQRLGAGDAAGGQVAARLARLGNARQHIWHGGAADQQDPLVAVADLGDVTLRHDRARAVVRDGFQDGVQVRLVRLQHEDAGAAHAVERFDHHLAEVAVELAQRVRLAGDQRRHREIGELRDRELLVMVAQRPRVVEHHGAVALGGREQVGGVKVLGVERRVLPHQHRVEAGQRPRSRVEFGVPGRAFAFRRQQPQALRPRGHPVLAPLQFGRRAGPDVVPAGGRRPHHRHRRILVGLQQRQRIDDEQQRQAL